jgi:hypothetical protein
MTVGETGVVRTGGQAARSVKKAREEEGKSDRYGTHYAVTKNAQKQGRRLIEEAQCTYARTCEGRIDGQR